MLSSKAQLLTTIGGGLVDAGAGSAFSLPMPDGRNPYRLAINRQFVRNDSFLLNRYIR
jgi:hypothetical protein